MSRNEIGRAGKEGVNEIGPLRLELMDSATASLTRAFAEESIFKWIIPDPQHRARALEVMNSGPLRYALRYGHAVQSHDGRAVAAWLPPGVGFTPLRLIRCGMYGLRFRVGVHAARQFARANQMLRTIRAAHMPEPHWYLMIVGVAPELQGRGLGTALVTEGLRRAAQDDAPCYLDTAEERNLRFYERLGFRVVETAVLDGVGPRTWAMRRDPDSRSGP